MTIVQSAGTLVEINAFQSLDIKEVASITRWWSTCVFAVSGETRFAFACEATFGVSASGISVTVVQSCGTFIEVNTRFSVKEEPNFTRWSTCFFAISNETIFACTSEATLIICTGGINVAVV